MAWAMWLLPVPGAPRKQSVFALGDEAGGGELEDERAVDFLVEGEVEAVEGAVGVAESGLLVSPGEEAVLTALELVGDERGDEVDGGHLLDLGLLQARVEDIGHAGEAQLAEGLVEFDEIHDESPVSAIDEIAVEGQFPDEGVDLPQRERRRGPAVEVAPHEPIGGEPEFEGGVGGLFDDGGTVLSGEGEDAEDAADAGGAVVAVDVVADGGDGGTGRAWRRRAGRGSWAECGRAGPGPRCDASPEGARRCSRRSCPVRGSSKRTWAPFHCTSTRRPIQPGGAL